MSSEHALRRGFSVLVPRDLPIVTLLRAEEFDRIVNGDDDELKMPPLPVVLVTPEGKVLHPPQREGTSFPVDDGIAAPPALSLPRWCVPAQIFRQTSSQFSMGFPVSHSYYCTIQKCCTRVCFWR